ncbi:MAG TPA: hypothetical protein VGP94_02285 [Tepidisphaeraceae bacterium]|nr:hypothetical protein [Tepidisphaeraceae bacterium]
MAAILNPPRLLSDKSHTMFGLLKSALGTFFLFLFLLCATLWVRSYFVTELCQHTVTTNENLAFAKSIFGVASGRGGVYVIKAQTTWAVPNKKKVAEETARIKDGWLRTIPTNPGYGGNYFNVARNGTFAGFGFGSTEESNNISTVASTSLVFPYAFPTIVLGLLGWGLINHTRAERRRRHFVQSTEFADNNYLRPREAA